MFNFKKLQKENDQSQPDLATDDNTDSVESKVQREMESEYPYLLETFNDATDDAADDVKDVLIEQKAKRIKPKPIQSGDTTNTSQMFADVDASPKNRIVIDLETVEKLWAQYTTQITGKTIRPDPAMELSPGWALYCSRVYMWDRQRLMRIQQLKKLGLAETHTIDYYENQKAIRPF
jgi:hypothetical protein